MGSRQRSGAATRARMRRPATHQRVAREAERAGHRVAQLERGVIMLGRCRRTLGDVVEMQLGLPAVGSLDHGAVRLQDEQVLAVRGRRLSYVCQDREPEAARQYAHCATPQKVKTCSSAIRMTGGPPLEIFAACARVSLQPAEAAHACSASTDGKWTSAMR